MTTALTTLLDELLTRTPNCSAEEQEAGVAVYHLLSRGTPVAGGEIPSGSAGRHRGWVRCWAAPTSDP